MGRVIYTLSKAEMNLSFILHKLAVNSFRLNAEPIKSLPFILSSVG